MSDTNVHHSAEYVAPDECSHSWRTCPVHSTGTDEMPSFATVVTCIYGGAELKDGGTWNEDTSKEVLARMWARIDGGGSDAGQ